MKIKYLTLLLVSLIALSGCSKTKPANKVDGGSNPDAKTAEKRGPKKMTVKKNDKVKVHYTGKLENGDVFDKSMDGQPLEFVVGSGQVIPGFDRAVEGMKLEEEKDVKIEVDDAYGQRNESYVKDFPKKNLPEGFVPTEGATIALQDNMGRPIPGTITEVKDESFTVDLNHPLAGKVLNFNIKVIEIQ